MRLQEQNTKAAQQWIAASMKGAQPQQRNVRFAQEWMHNGAEALRELEKRTEDRESLVKHIDRKIRTNSQGKTLP